MTLRTLYARARATGRLWNTLLVFIDAGVVLVATVLAYYARFEGPAPEPFARWVGPLIGAAVITYGTALAIAGLYRLVLRYVGVDTLLKLLGAVVISAALLIVLDIAVPRETVVRPVPFGVLFIQAILVFLGASAARLGARIIVFLQASRRSDRRRILILGAGSAGSLLHREIQNRPDLELQVVGFLDDDRGLKGRTLNGVRVLGTTEELAELVRRHGVEEIIVAMPSSPRETVRRILNAAADAGVQTRVMPELVIARGAVSLRDLRSVDVEDLLGREPTPIDVEQVRETIAGKVVAVTGAAGSIGSELCRQIVGMAPDRLLLIDIDETRLYELWLELGGPSSDTAVMCVCDIRDRDRLDAVIGEHKPALLLHAAAYKHVPLMELAPAEAVKTNVLGTRNVIEVCERRGVGRFVLISTDKACAPVNIMGLTKSLAERLMLVATRGDALEAVAVRFGNVLASRGSVVPIFQEQLRHGRPLTVTHREVTRYFMTIPEASRLVLQAQAIGSGGDIFVLEMGEPVKIVDLARKMIALSGVPADIEFVGLRPGEKLHEVLVNGSEVLLPTEREKIRRVDCVTPPNDQFDADIGELMACAVAGDAELLRVLFERLEPGFAERASDPGTP